MDVKGLIIVEEEAKEELHKEVCQFQDSSVSNIDNTANQQFRMPDVQQTSYKTSVECALKSRPSEDCASKQNGGAHALDLISAHKSSHFTDEVHKSKNKSYVILESILKRDIENPPQFFKYESIKSNAAFLNQKWKSADAVAQGHTFSGESVQRVNLSSEEKNVEVSVTPSNTIGTGRNMISQDISGGKYDFNFIRNYWIAAFASNPEYGLYEQPPQNGYCCPFCDFVGKDSNCVLNHWRTHFGDQQYYQKDNQRTKTYFEEQKLFPPVRYYSSKLSKLRPNKCRVCQKSFSKYRALQKHMVTHYKSEPFKCNICNKAFFLKHSLDSHLKIHSNTNKYNCTHCGKEYTYVSSLDRHLRTVHNEA